MFFIIIKFIFIVLCFLYLYIGYRYINIYKSELNKEVTFINKNDINTGDILLLNFDNDNIFTDGILGFKYYHAGIAVWDNEELYIIEYAYYKKEKDGILKHNFNEFSYYNIDSVMMLNKLYIKDDSKEKRDNLAKNILDFYNSIKDEKDIHPYFGLDWYRFLTQDKDKYKKIDFNISKHVTCLEILACMLCEIGIVKKNKSISYLPNKFIGMKGFDLEKNFNYDKNFLCNLSFY